MKWIIKPRGMGKTTDLFRLAKENDMSILVANDTTARWTQEKAKQEGYDIKVYSVTGNFHGKDEGYLIDEVEMVLQSLLHEKGVKFVDTVTLTIGTVI